MRKQTRRALSYVTPALLAVAAWAATAQATPTVPSPTPVRDRICRAECRQDASACMSAARQEGRMCGEGCLAEVQEAAHSCAGNPSGKGCEGARERARTCLAPCAQTRAVASRNCRGDLRSCFALCPEVEPLPSPGAKDPNCVADCSSVVGECVPAAREQARVCLKDGCADLTDDASEACGADAASEECRLAQRAALGCMRDCRNTLREGTRNCARNGESCIRSCPDVEPETPTPPAE